MSVSKPSKRDRKFMLCTGELVPLHLLREHERDHIIGELHYLFEHGIFVTALAVYEQSRLRSDVPMNLPPIRITVIGDAREIKCTKCKNEGKWNTSRTGAFLFFDRVMKNFPASGL